MKEENALIVTLTKHFAFMLEEKYHLGTIKDTGPMGCWEVGLESDSSDVIFKLISDRNQILLVMANREEKFWVSLDVVVFFITNKAISFPGDSLENLDDVNGQLSHLAAVLVNHIEQIKIIFGKNSKLYKDELTKSMNNFRLIQVDAIKKENPKTTK